MWAVWVLFVQDREAVWADPAAAERGHDPHHVCHAAALLRCAEHQQSKHQAASPFR